MLPMVMRGDLISGEVKWSGHYLINPWSRRADGSPEWSTPTSNSTSTGMYSPLGMSGAGIQVE